MSIPRYLIMCTPWQECLDAQRMVHNVARGPPDPLFRPATWVNPPVVPLIPIPRLEPLPDGLPRSMMAVVVPSGARVQSAALLPDLKCARPVTRLSLLIAQASPTQSIPVSSA